MPKRLVLARNYQEFVTWAREEGISIHDPDLVYVRDATQIEKHAGSDCLLYYIGGQRWMFDRSPEEVNSIQSKLDWLFPGTPGTT